MLLVLLLAACTASNQIIEVPLLNPASSKVLLNQTKHFKINVSNSLPGSANFGGTDGMNNIEFKQVVPWLKNQLSLLDLSNCSKSSNQNITLSIKLNKLYSEIDSNTMVGHLSLIVKFQKNSQTPIMRYYNASCVVSFFATNDSSGLTECFNSAISKIIPIINKDLCKLSGVSKSGRV